ncbi:MAG: hypothetical protein RSG55_08405, partial [Oscillospiraceae bacterium]
MALYEVKRISYTEKGAKPCKASDHTQKKAQSHVKRLIYTEKGRGRAMRAPTRTPRPMGAKP